MSFLEQLNIPPDFTGIHATKWERVKNIGSEGVLPLWIADMDFEIAPEIKKAVSERAQIGFYGYTKKEPAYFEAVKNWFLKRHNWAINTEWILNTPGVICAIHTAINAFSEKDDYILIQPPVYHPFFRVIKRTERKVLESPLIERDGDYEIDFSDFEEKIRKYSPKIFILCNPHNPIGKIYTKEELLRFGDICDKYNVLILSDEIHADLTAPGIVHIPLGSLGEKYALNSIICTAPSKTFNLAGLHFSNIMIQNEELRNKFQTAFQAAGIPDSNLFALTASKAAYQYGGQWLDSVREYILQNRLYAEQYLRENIPSVKFAKAQGTYFIWLDFRSLGLGNKELEAFLLDKAKIWLNQGYEFGKEGGGFARLNLATQRSILEKALEQLKDAVSAFILD